MRIAAAVAALALLAGSAAAQERLPADVAAFLERHTGCDHWAGEEPYDADRRAEIDKALDDLRCASLDADGVFLKRKYAGNAAVLAALKQADD